MRAVFLLGDKGDGQDRPFAAAAARLMVVI
jgi:hypothetical protein